MYLLAFAGLIWESLEGNWKAGALLAVLTAQLLLNSFSVAWWEGLSFGLRQMTGCAVPVGLGVAFFLEAIARKPSPSMGEGRDGGDSRSTSPPTSLLPRKGGGYLRGIQWIVALSAVWTFFLAVQSYARNLDLLFYLPPRALLAKAWEWGPLLRGLQRRAAEFNQTYGDVFWMLLLIELLIGGWVWRLLRVPVRKKGRAMQVPYTLILCTFLPWLLYADARIFLARQGTRPDWTQPSPLNERQLAGFFEGESCEVRALYHAQRGEAALAAQYFDLADQSLPDTPAVRPWRDQLREFRMKGAL